MVHDAVDIERWIAEFRLTDLREEAQRFVQKRVEATPSEYSDETAVTQHIQLMSPRGQQITGPYDIAVVEQLRAEALPDTGTTTKVPTDVFVFSVGEPEKRMVTKIGGIPYRAGSKAWPQSPLERPLTFVAQVCFADSHDLVGELPGDVLLIFGDEHAVWDEQDGAFTFEWIQRDAITLVTADQIPHTEWSIAPCYGHIYRTWDYSDARNRFTAYHCPYWLNVIEGTKIGGVPRWIQEPVDLPGQFLCAIGSINPDAYTGRPYPFINTREPARADTEPSYLMWGDVGSLYLFLTPNGTVSWSLQYY